MNDAQRIVLESYGLGDYAWLTDASEYRADALAQYSGEPDPIEEYLAAEGGDTLLLYLYRELKDDDVTNSKEEALRRVDASIADLVAIRHELEEGL